jgi:hypothetical protein
LQTLAPSLFGIKSLLTFGGNAPSFRACPESIGERLSHMMDSGSAPLSRLVRNDGTVSVKIQQRLVTAAFG